MIRMMLILEMSLITEGGDVCRHELGVYDPSFVLMIYHRRPVWRNEIEQRPL